MVNKQQVLDTPVTSTEHAALIQLVTRLSKTETEAAKRVFNKLEHLLYTTAMKELPFRQLVALIHHTLELLKEGQSETLQLLSPEMKNAKK